MPYFADTADGPVFDPAGRLNVTTCAQCGTDANAGKIVLIERLTAYRPIVRLEGDTFIYEAGDGPQHASWGTLQTVAPVRGPICFKATCLNCDHEWPLPGNARVEEGIRDVDHGA